jgi:Peptidase A4 family
MRHFYFAVAIGSLACTALFTTANAGARPGNARINVRSSAAAPAPSVNAIRPQVAWIPCPNGLSVEKVTRAAGFDPLTATHDELVTNALPPPPSDASKLPVWQHFVTTTVSVEKSHPRIPECPQLSNTGRYSAPPKARSSLAAARPSDETIKWSGNIAHGQTFTDAEAQWTVPNVANAVQNSDSLSWVGVGLGNYDTYPIIQAGSESNFGRNPNLWWEVYPEIGVQPFKYGAFVGDYISVHVLGGPNSAVFHVVDESTGIYYGPFKYPGNFNIDGHAEWIYERLQDGNGNCHPLANATPYFQNAEAAAGGVWGALGNLSHYFVTMWSSDYSLELAIPGPIESNKLNFGNIFKNSGILEPC